MKKCTLCIDRIYNEALEPVDRVPACVKTCPVSARHFGDLGDPGSDVSRLVAERGGYDLMPELGYAPTNKYLPPRTRAAPPAIGIARCARGRRVSRLDRPAALRLIVHPSPSIIVFTTLTGAGYGLLFWLGLGAAAHALPPDRLFGAVALDLRAARGDAAGS